MNDGGPAFPRPATTVTSLGGDRRTVTEQVGMSLRDHFAGLAMQALIPINYANDGTLVQDVVAQWSYEIADAMLAERKKSNAAV